MRHPKRHEATDGTVTYRVRYRISGVDTSQTFARKNDADTFAAIMAAGGVSAALDWLAGRQAHHPTAPTFAEWFDTWADQLTGITPRTLADYHSQRRRYLAHLDTLPLTAISRTHVTAVVNKLDREGKSRKTIQNVLHMLASCLALAVDEGHIARNPCRRIRPPAARIDTTEARFLTRPEVAALIANTAEHYQPFVTFLFGTGLRWAEATALPCRNVDLDHGTIRIDRAWKRVPGGQEIGPPKSAKAKRTVNAAVPALLAAQAAMGRPGDLLWRAPGGGPVHHGNFYNRVWVPACQAAGLTDPRPRIHDTRHTHASWLISDGQALEAVQDQLGHESYETTRKVYAHLLPAVGVAVGKSASAAMEDVLAQAAELGAARLAIEPGSDPQQ